MASHAFANGTWLFNFTTACEIPTLSKSCIRRKNWNIADGPSTLRKQLVIHRTRAACDSPVVGAPEISKLRCNDELVSWFRQRMHALRERHRAPVDDPSRHARPRQYTLARLGSHGKYLLESRRFGQLILGWQPPTPSRLLLLPPSELPLLLRCDATIRRKSRPTHIHRRRFVPSQPCFEHRYTRRQLPNHLKLMSVGLELLQQQLQQLLCRDRPRRNTPFQTSNVPAEERNHPPIREMDICVFGEHFSGSCYGRLNVRKG